MVATNALHAENQTTTLRTVDNNSNSLQKIHIMNKWQDMTCFNLWISWNKEDKIIWDGKQGDGWRFHKSVVLGKMMKNEQEVVCTWKYLRRLEASWETVLQWCSTKSTPTFTVFLFNTYICKGKFGTQHFIKRLKPATTDQTHMCTASNVSSGNATKTITV